MVREIFFSEPINNVSALLIISVSGATLAFVVTIARPDCVAAM